MQRSRNALADLAHALKTPLTVLQQLLSEDALTSQPEMCHALQAQTNNMQSMMARVLKRARMAGSGPSLIKFDINFIAEHYGGQLNLHTSNELGGFCVEVILRNVHEIILKRY